MPVTVQKSYRTPIRLDQKRKFPWHISIKTLNLQNKERIVKLPGKKNK